jgi:hypothetical protein
MMFMIERIRLGNTFKCPSCRTRVNIDEISYVSEGSGTQGEYAHINVKVCCFIIIFYFPPTRPNGPILFTQGSWGTKIEAVVRELLVLQQTEPGAKALLFSQWNEVLEIVSRALGENGVKFARVKGKRSVEVCNLVCVLVWCLLFCVVCVCVCVVSVVCVDQLC